MLGVRGTALSWFTSNWTASSQRVSVNGTLSKNFELNWGVPQGSCLGPLFSIVYSSKLFEIIESHLPNTHACADDTQLYLSFNPNDSTGQATALAAIERRINDMRSLMFNDKLMLPRQQLAKVSISSIKVGEADISPDCAVRNLGAWFDSKLTMDTHITKTCSAAFFFFIFIVLDTLGNTFLENWLIF